jgi:hypothetical protein
MDWTLDWTGLVKHGLVKHGLVKHGLVKHGLVKHGLVNYFCRFGNINDTTRDLTRCSCRSASSNTTY